MVHCNACACQTHVIPTESSVNSVLYPCPAVQTTIAFSILCSLHTTFWRADYSGKNQSWTGAQIGQEIEEGVDESAWFHRECKQRSLSTRIADSSERFRRRANLDQGGRPIHCIFQPVVNKLSSLRLKIGTMHYLLLKCFFCDFSITCVLSVFLCMTCNLVIANNIPAI